MGLIQLFYDPCPAPAGQKAEISRLLDTLFKIGKSDDYLSERPGGPFNAQCRHAQAREIGKRLNEIGGMPLMEWAHRKTRKKLGKELAAHLEYAWAEIGPWMP